MLRIINNSNEIFCIANKFRIKYFIYMCSAIHGLWYTKKTCSFKYWTVAFFCFENYKLKYKFVHIVDCNIFPQNSEVLITN